MLATIWCVCNMCMTSSRMHGAHGTLACSLSRLHKVACHALHMQGCLPNAETGTTVHMGEITCVRFSRDSRMVYAGSTDSTIYCWDLKSQVGAQSLQVLISIRTYVHQRIWGMCIACLCLICETDCGTKHLRMHVWGQCLKMLGVVADPGLHKLFSAGQQHNRWCCLCAFPPGPGPQVQ